MRSTIEEGAIMPVATLGRDDRLDMPARPSALKSSTQRATIFADTSYMRAA